MKDWLPILAEAAGAELGDERFVAGVPAATRGFMRRSAASVSGSLAVIAVTGSGRANELAGESLPTNLVLGVTATRLFLFELSIKRATVGELQTIVPLRDVVGVDATRARTFMVKKLDVDLAFGDGSALTLEVGGPALAQGEQFVEAVQAVIGARRAPAVEAE